MNILVTGASGFIASQIVTDIMLAGHAVTCCVRDTERTKRLFPGAKIIACDFIHDTHSDKWIERLENIDVVINCVGIFYHPNKNIMWAIHYDTPKALFDACVKSGVKKIIQLSALGIDIAEVEYAKSKKAADDYLLTLPIKSFILRPSLVYGRGSYGGTSLFRGLSGLPWLLPVPGKGTQEFQPIHLQDLAKAIIYLLDVTPTQSVIVSAVSNKRITLAEILTTMRAWLGFATAKLFFIPLSLIRLGALLGNLIPYSSLSITAYKMLSQNSTANIEETKKFHQHIGFTPQDFDAGIYRQPSTVQDHWHARLYFLKPLLQISIAFTWFFTALCSAFFYSKTSSYALLAQVGINNFWQPLLLYGASILDAALGIAMLCSYKLKKTCILQIAVIIFYSIIILWKLPYLWLDPFAPIIKNLVLLVGLLIFLALESDR